MHNFFKKILFVAFLILCVATAIFNYHIVEFNLFGFKVFEVPLFLVVFCSFFVGSMLNLFYFLFSKK